MPIVIAAAVKIFWVQITVIIIIIIIIIIITIIIKILKQTC